MTEGVFELSDELVKRTRRSRVKAVVLAGGKGTRLAPYTSVLPKPLMPIGDRSILELVIGQFATFGITDVTLCVGHLSHLIEAVLDSRQHEGIHIRFVREEEALGTAAPLRLVEGLDRTFIAMNGDVLTRLPFDGFIRYHRRNRNALTIAARERCIQIDYGVIHLGENGRRNQVAKYVEKPQMTSVVSMGIYALEPAALAYIPPSGYFDFPELVQALLRAGEKVGAYRYDGLWFDIGRRDDYEEAVAAWNVAPPTVTASQGAAAQVPSVRV
jgi:NDP-sugar pyrophosphorylase family protein